MPDLLPGVARVPLSDANRRRTEDRAPPFLPFLDGPPSFAPNLTPIDASTWLLPDSEADDWLDEKRLLLRVRRDEVAGGIMDSDAALELLALVRDATGLTPVGDWPSALEQAASIVSDDFCILQAKRPGDWRLTAGVLCAPTFWTLPERLGLDLGGLHGPVPGGDPALAARIGRVFTGLKPGVVLQRLNWTVQVGAARYTPERPSAAGKSVDDLFLRVERQTLRKLPTSGAVVFSIRICIDRLLPILAQTSVREAFEDAWLGASVKVRTYKAWHGVEALVAEACRIGQAN